MGFARSPELNQCYRLPGQSCRPGDSWWACTQSGAGFRIGFVAPARTMTTMSVQRPSSPRRRPPKGDPLAERIHSPQRECERAPAARHEAASTTPLTQPSASFGAEAVHRHTEAKHPTPSLGPRLTRSPVRRSTPRVNLPPGMRQQSAAECLLLRSRALRNLTAAMRRVLVRPRLFTPGTLAIT